MTAGILSDSSGWQLRPQKKLLELLVLEFRQNWCYEAVFFPFFLGPWLPCSDLGKTHPTVTNRSNDGILLRKKRGDAGGIVVTRAGTRK